MNEYISNITHVSSVYVNTYVDGRVRKYSNKDQDFGFKFFT